MIKIGRRAFMASTGAALAIPGWAHAAPRVLKAEPVSLQILPEGQPATALLGFNGSSPGPELRVRQGDTMALRFVNATGEPGAVHWHGIRIQNSMDGVPGMTQPLVNQGDTFDYRVNTPDAGTFWYHSHHRSWEQVAKGLYGPLIVEEANPPDVDQDITVMLDDWRIEENGALMGGFGNMHDFAHGGRLGNAAMVLPSRETVGVGERVRLRLINTATARIFPVRIEGVDGVVVALDGMPLPEPRPLSDLILAPAQRVDVIGDVTRPVAFNFVARDTLIEMGTLDASNAARAPRSEPVPVLPAADVAMPKPDPDRSMSLVMEGGAMGGAHAGSDIWALNGVSGLPDKPFGRFERGENVVIELVNDTAFPHGMHLHGHHFHELNGDGTPGDRRDTTLVERGETRRIAVVFDNPGKWLLHCHMLGHQASGMKTWVEVS